MTPEELQTWKELNELECVKKAFGKWSGGDMYSLQDEAELRVYVYQDHCDGCEFEVSRWQAVRVLPLFDPIRPERSLWGMSEAIREEWSIVQAGIFIASEHPDLYLAEMIIERRKG